MSSLSAQGAYKPSKKNPQRTLTYNVCTHDITIDESSARLVYQDVVAKRGHFALSFTFLGVSFSCVTSLVTSSFNSTFGVSAEAIEGLFIVSAVVFGILFLVFLLYSLCVMKKFSEDGFIKKLEEYNQKQ